MNQERYTGIDGSNHGFGTDGMNLHHHSSFFRFIHDGSKNFQFLIAGTRNRSQCDLAREFDSHGGHLAYLGTSHFRSVIGKANGTRWDNSWSIDLATVDVIPEG